MNQTSNRDLRFETERLLAHYQTLYWLAVRLCGVLDLSALIDTVTDGAMESFDVDDAAMVVFSEEAKPALTPLTKSIYRTVEGMYGHNARCLTEMVQLDGAVVAPIREAADEPPLAILILIGEPNHLDLQAIRKKLTSLEPIVATATRRAVIESRRQRAFEQTQTDNVLCELIGESQPMQALKAQILQVAAQEITVLIQGETGTGKELVARAIHQSSQRKDKPFVSFNCGALPETLIESELFGHVKGAFTSATASRKGLFKQANGGTIFLDEIGEMPLAQQVKLLRVLQESEVLPLGADVPEQIDVRVIAATNRELLHDVNTGNFRSDLYYRLSVFRIGLPNLQDRDRDVLWLSNHFLSRYGPDRYLTQSAENALLAYNWPGNVRELENAIKHAIAVSTREITPDHLPIEITQPRHESSPVPHMSQPRNSSIEPIVRQFVQAMMQFSKTTSQPKGNTILAELNQNETFVEAVSALDLKTAREELERLFVQKVWNTCEQKQSTAARWLNISRDQLRTRLRRYGLLEP